MVDVVKNIADKPNHDLISEEDDNESDNENEITRSTTAEISF